MDKVYEVDIEEVEYLKHGDTAFIARMFRPRGEGPFPAVVEAHGGAWCGGARTDNDPINRRVAQGGIVVAALEFRNPPQATYPGSVADVNFGIRWLKAEANRFGTKPGMIGSMGTSSGGHLVVLNGLKPRDPRYAAIPLSGSDGDARVSYVVTLWPVICPLGRYHSVKAKTQGEQTYQGRGVAVQNQEKYWLTEAAMGEGSPRLALRRGDPVELPNILYLQHPADQLHPREHLEEFVELYRKIGGSVQVEFFAGESYDLLRRDPDSPGAAEAIGKIVAFIRHQAAAA